MKLKRIPILEFHFGEAFFTSTVGEIESSIKHLMENVAQAQLEADKRAINSFLKEATEKEQMWQGYTEMAVKEIFEELLENRELLELGRKAIEDVLVEWRDNRLSEFNRGNGLVIRERDGKDSSIIRLGSETALRIGLKAMLQALKQKYGGEK